MEDSQVGQILCAACPDSRTLITGGKNTVCVLFYGFNFFFSIFESTLLLILYSFSVF